MAINLIHPTDTIQGSSIDLTVKPAAQTGAQTGGTLYLQGANINNASAGAGSGRVYIVGGISTSPATAPGGMINIYGGQSAGVGGQINIVGGVGSNAGGAITITAGNDDGTNSGNSGAVAISTPAGTSTSGNLTLGAGGTTLITLNGTNQTITLNSVGALGTINNMSIGATTAATGRFTTLNVTSDIQVNGKKAVNGPTFRAYVDTAQTIPGTGVQTKVTFGTETFDTNNNFATSRFTPTVEGYYQLNAAVRIQGTSGTGEYMITIWRNGSEYARGTNASGTEAGVSFYSMQVADIAYANGSTDYFEIYIQQATGAGRDTTAGSNISHFSGAMVRGA